MRGAAPALARALLTGAIVLLAGLAGCGGDDTREADPPPERTLLRGTVMDTAARAGGVDAKPAAGVPTGFTSSRPGPYALVVEQMRPPYVLINQAGPALSSVATGPGIANLTPLTHLVVAELQGEEPGAFYAQLGPLGGNDFSRVTPALIAAAEARVRERLQRRFGLAVPASIESFVTTPFDAVPGDPMHDLVTALYAALTAQGLSLDDLVAEVVQQSRHCALESLGLAIGTAASVLCPASKESGPDAADAGITVHAFVNGLGDRLVLREQADAVLEVSYERDGSVQAACAGAACSGITLGTRATDGARLLGFAATRLGAVGGAGIGDVVLEGQLAAGNGAIDGGCAGRRFTVDYSSGAQEVECVAQRVATRRFARVSQAFIGKVDTTRVLDVRTDGETVVWVALARNVSEVEYRCKDSGCQGVSLGAPDARGVRSIRFEGTVLQRALGEGQVDAADTATLNAELLAAPVPPPAGTSCAQPVSLFITSSDGESLPLCDPRPGSSIGVDDADGDGITESIATGVDSPFGDFVQVSFNLDRGVANRVTLSRSFLTTTVPSYSCLDPACNGVTATRTADGRYVVRFEGTLLAEIDPDGGPGGRNVRFDGTILSATFGLGGD